jgi:hypothetical protein
MVSWIDYELEGIKIELKILENELAALEGEKMSIEKSESITSPMTKLNLDYNYSNSDKVIKSQENAPRMMTGTISKKSRFHPYQMIHQGKCYT